MKKIGLLILTLTLSQITFAEIKTTNRVMMFLTSRTLKLKQTAWTIT